MAVFSLGRNELLYWIGSVWTLNEQGHCGACRRKWRLSDMICVLVARPRRCLTLSNPVPWQNWTAAYLGYTLRMRTLFRGWPIMVKTHIREEEEVWRTAPINILYPVRCRIICDFVLTGLNRSSLKTGPAGARKNCPDITAVDIDLFFFTVPVQWSYMTNSACRHFTACIKGPNTGSF